MASVILITDLAVIRGGRTILRASHIALLGDITWCRVINFATYYEIN